MCEKSFKTDVNIYPTVSQAAQLFKIIKQRFFTFLTYTSQVLTLPSAKSCKRKQEQTQTTPPRETYFNEFFRGDEKIGGTVTAWEPALFKKIRHNKRASLSLHQISISLMNNPGVRTQSSSAYTISN